MEKQQVNVLKYSPVRNLLRRSHKVVFPGAHGASVYEVGKFFFTEVKTLKLQERAAAVTYNFFMALPPTFLILFSLVPFLPLKNVEQTILNTIQLLSPNHAIYVTLRSVVSDFMNKRHQDVLSYGVILVMYFSSNGIMGLMRSFDKSLSLYVERSGFQRRWTAVKLTLLLIGVSMVALSVLIVQSKKLNPFLMATFHSIVAVKLLSVLILICIIFIAVSIIYTYGPSLTHRFNFVSTGSVVATTASVLATSIFFFFVNHFLNYNKIYGSIGTLIAFMVLIWLNTNIILLGYELNVSILLGKLSKGDIDEE
jgi:membrane protein